VQSTSYWGSGLAIGGEIGGFSPEYASLINNCRYNPRPYAYKLTDRSNTGYRHDIYMVDYIVREGPGLWGRSNVPVLCYASDRIFQNGFE
jgi:hypothetical protein